MKGVDLLEHRTLTLGKDATEVAGVPSGLMSALIADARYTTVIFCLLRRDTLVACLPCYLPKGDGEVSPDYDLVRMGYGDLLAPRRRRLLVGGYSELHAAMVFSSTAPEDLVSQRLISAILITDVTQFCCHEGLQPVAIYANAALSDACVEAWDSCVTDSLSSSWELLTTGTSFEAHVSAQRAGVRATLRRDVRDFAARGLSVSADAVTALSYSDLAMIESVITKHSTSNNSSLDRVRLSLWLTRHATTGRVFRVLDRDGVTVAVSVGATVPGLGLRMYEVGMLQEYVHRGFAYILAVVHGPLLLALREGVTSVDLGNGADRPKRLRGALAQSKNVVIAQKGSVGEV